MSEVNLPHELDRQIRALRRRIEKLETGHVLHNHKGIYIPASAFRNGWEDFTIDSGSPVSSHDFLISHGLGEVPGTILCDCGHERLTASTRKENVNDTDFRVFIDHIDNSSWSGSYRVWWIAAKTSANWLNT